MCPARPIDEIAATAVTQTMDVSRTANTDAIRGDRTGLLHPVLSSAFFKQTLSARTLKHGERSERSRLGARIVDHRNGVRRILDRPAGARVQNV